MTKTEVVASVLFFMEYRINYNAKFVHDRVNRYLVSLDFLFTHLQSSEIFKDEFQDLAHLKRKVYDTCKFNNWNSIECVIDQMDLRSGNSGNFDFVQRGKAITTFKNVFEKHYGIPVTRILLMVKDSRADVN